MRIVYNSAVITAPGTYTYRLLSREEAQAWVDQGFDAHTIGYAETCIAFAQLFGLGALLPNREVLTMAPGDEALVFRLRYPQGTRPEVVQKGMVGVDFIQNHCELGLLERKE